MKSLPLVFILLAHVSLWANDPYCAGQAHCDEDILSDEVRPNILFIAVDDLLPALGCYGDPVMLHGGVTKTPVIDDLAALGTTFLNHHVALPICGGSRASLTTGLMPEHHGVTLFTSLRHPDYLPDVVTLPQHFKNNGYETAARGKFHDDRTVGDTTKAFDTETETYPDGQVVDDPASWSIPFAGVFGGDSNAGIPAGTKPAAYAGLNSGTYSDEKSVAPVKGLLDQLEAGHKPFFLALGWLKPHLPFIAPKEYWDIHDWDGDGNYDDDLPLPTFTTSPANAPGSFSWIGEIHKYDGFTKQDLPNDQETRELRHGYYACVSMIDDLTGQVLDYLATKDDPVQAGKKMDETTIVVFWGDHGLVMGEHGRWAKHIDDELSSWAPLIIYDPRNPGNGGQTMAPVSSLDIFPTLCELAGLPIPTQPIDNVTPTGRPLPGRSLVPIMEDPTVSVNGGALIHKTVSGEAYIYRTEQYRLIEKYTVTEAPNGEEVVSIDHELYDLGTDRVELVNVAGQASYDSVIHELTTAMRNEPAAQDIVLLEDHGPSAPPTNRKIPGLTVTQQGANDLLTWPSSSGSGSAYTVKHRPPNSSSFTVVNGLQSVTGGSALVSGLNGDFKVELDDNLAPHFPVDPIMSSQATAGKPYQSTLSGSAIDPSPTYQKIAGPAWLSVASDGFLSGTPSSVDYGANYFTIAATDAEGATTESALYIFVDLPVLAFYGFDGGNGVATASVASLTAGNLTWNTGTITSSDGRQSRDGYPHFKKYGKQATLSLTLTPTAGHPINVSALSFEIQIDTKNDGRFNRKMELTSSATANEVLSTLYNYKYASCFGITGNCRLGSGFEKRVIDLSDRIELQNLTTPVTFTFAFSGPGDLNGNIRMDAIRVHGDAQPNVVQLADYGFDSGASADASANNLTASNVTWTTGTVQNGGNQESLDGYPQFKKYGTNTAVSFTLTPTANRQVNYNDLAFQIQMAAGANRKMEVTSSATGSNVLYTVYNTMYGTSLGINDERKLANPGNFETKTVYLGGITELQGVTGPVTFTFTFDGLGSSTPGNLQLDAIEVTGAVLTMP